jgi:hypothetical protein
MLKYEPAVFAVGKVYQIMVMVRKPSLMWVEIGGTRYYDETNGILRSKKRIHRITVPADELDAAGEYTLCEREIIKRLAYHTMSTDEKRYRFSFTPVEDGKEIRAFHIADTHSHFKEPVKAASAFGKCDFLILNGDILNHCENAADFGIVYRIASEITHGRIPIVFSRGNHDMRGANTEIFSDYTPNCGGRTYYTFRLGCVWGMVLDCGEDKPDSHPEYGHTVCCHQFRLRQTDFIREVIADAQNEYLADGVRHRIIISHIPFTHNMGGEFEIENEIYSEWAKLIEENINPNLMIYAHLHEISINKKGSDFDSYGIQPCTAVVASQLDKGFAGCGFVFGADKVTVSAVSDRGETLFTEIIE